MASETCCISSRDMERFLKRSYGIPDDVKLVKPSSNQTIFDKPHGTVAVYLDFFEQCGLRNLPHWYSIRARPKPKPRLIHSVLVSSVWRRKFVFIGEDVFPKAMTWKSDNHYPRPLPYMVGTMFDDVCRLRGFGVDWSILLSEEMLHSAKMPNVYSGPLPVKFRDEMGNEISKSAVDFLREISEPCGFPADQYIEAGWNLSFVDDSEEEESVGKDGKLRKTLGGDATPSKRVKLSDKSVLDGSPLSDDDVQVRYRYKESDSEVAAALNLVENYHQELNVEVEKNVALEKAKTELEAACKEALKKNLALEEALEKAKKEVEASRIEASNYDQGWKAEVKKNVALKEALEMSQKELEMSKKELEISKKEASSYRQKIAANLVLERSLINAKRELDAEKKRSANAQEETDKAKKSAAAAQQEASNLHSRIRAFYLQCCSKD